MTTLAFLQNQWVRHPERAQAMIEQHGESYRRRFIAAALFSGCLTGRRLVDAFGVDATRRITWENASPQIAAKSRGRFPADIMHMRNVIRYVQPDIIIAFGTVAQDGLIGTGLRHPQTIYAPHPAARQPGVVTRLKEVAEIWRQFDSSHD